MKQSYIDEMLDSQRAGVSVFLSILLDGGGGDSRYFVFEGEDSKYYSSRIRHHYPKEVKFYNCEGKDNVLAAYEMMSKVDRFKSCYFFVDKDFDDIKKLPRDRIYCTPTYSIENFYCTKDAFERILMAEFFSEKGSLAEDNLPGLLGFYDEVVSVFFDASACFHAVLLGAKSQGVLLRHSETEITDVFKLDFKSRIVKRLTKFSIAKLKKDAASKIEVAEILKLRKMLKSSDMGSSFRGKYLLQFIFAMLCYLRTDASSSKPKEFTKKIRVKLQLSKANIISELSQYADTPECLKKFLAEN